MLAFLKRGKTVGFLKNSFGSPGRIIAFLLTLTMVLSLTQFRVFADIISTDDSEYPASEMGALEENTQEITASRIEVGDKDAQTADKQLGDTQTEDSQIEDTQTEDMQTEDTESKSIQTGDSKTEDTQTEDVNTGGTQTESTAVLYDVQPLTKEQVQAAIDGYETEYQEVLSRDGFLAASEVEKPHWQYYVSAELIPSGYRCELVSEESDAYDGFGAMYYTFFVGAAATYQIVDGGAGIVVYEVGEFRTALSNAAYTTIYLGADITMATAPSAANLVVGRSVPLVINGINPLSPEDGKHTYTDFRSDGTNSSLYGACTDITFKDMNIYLHNYYGIFRSSTGAFNVTFDGVTGVAGQFFCGYSTSTSSTLLIRDSELTLRRTYNFLAELAQWAKSVSFEGTVRINRESGVNEGPIFTLNSGTVQIADNADVIINNVDSSGYTVFNGVTNLTVGDGAKFACYSLAAFCSSPLTTVTIGANADVHFICTRSHLYNSFYGSANSTLKAGPGSNFLLYDNETDGGYSVCYFTYIILDNPESFVVMNPSARAIGGTYVPKITANDVSSIRYYPTGQIANLFNTSTYAYTPSRTYSNWWAQRSLFNVEKASWSSTSSVTTTNYEAVNRPTASVPVSVMNDLTANNFTATSSIYGVEIYGTIYKLTYDGNNAESGTVPESDTGVPNDLMTAKGNTGNLVREGYIFRGWNTEPDGGGTHYNVGDTFRIEEDTVLYAEWEKDLTKFAIVTYCANDGTDETFSEEGLKDRAYEIIANPFNYAGHNFIGWNTQADGNGDNYSEHDVISPLDHDIILYAQWEAKATDLVFRKIDAETTEAAAVVPLVGAEFELYSCQDDSHQGESDHKALGEAGSCWVLSDITAAYSGSIVTFEGLGDGFYLLMETVAPDGYQRPKGQWVIKAEEGSISFVGISGNTDTPAVVTRDNFDGREEGDSVEFWIGNIVQYELPIAGGSGTLWYTTLGSLLLVAGTILAAIYRRQRVKCGI